MTLDPDQIIENHSCYRRPVEGDICEWCGFPWPCLENRLAEEVKRLTTALRKSLKQGWSEGYTSGHSRAMRLMSDEPQVENAVNPYNEKEKNV